MAAPFLREVPIDPGAAIVKKAFRRERVLRDRHDPLAHPDHFLIGRYGFSRQGIIYLRSLLEPHVANGTRRSKALTVTQTLCIALRFFRRGTFLYAVGDAEHIANATVSRTIRKVYLGLKRFLNVFVRFPGHAEGQPIKNGFYAIAGFPNVIGVVDCIQIPIKAPSRPGDFVNGKGFASINVQIISDSACLISNVEAKWPGSVHNSRIFRESDLCKAFERGAYDGVLIGDGSYACLPFLMTPYADPTPGPQSAYNAALVRTRAQMEMTLEKLKGRFQCLGGLRVAPSRACDIVVACVVLHNIATIRKERVPAVPLQPNNNDPGEPMHADQARGRATRDGITAQHFG
ncbi:putative nuclease HARBI1 [Lampris incognitus]|uniref:putative nuclease HARBI1 n=1 Tax=Lampris incognitus TaxID=2546036 RepID=UPI0024B6098A|nr:putative nuclease HARBI1 [Lampris incognitus]